MRPWPIVALLLATACSNEPPSNRNVAQSAPLAPPAETPSNHPAAEDAPSSVLTATGWGPLRIGMTLEQVVAAAGSDSNPDAVGGAEPEHCDQFRPARAPDGLLVMMENGRLARISLLDRAEIETVHGIGLGATAASVKARLGEQARVSPHKYQSPGGEYIDVWTSPVPDASYVRDPQARGIRYEVGADGLIQAIHAGGPAIQYVEGCL